jgi:hypothetical protein
MGGSEQKPLSLDMGLVRQFETVNFRLHPRTPRANFAFVLGDTASGLAKLEGAQKEARRVAELLKSRDYTVTELYEARSFDVVRELFASDYRILHIATHGEFDETDPKRSGIVLGPDLRLSACELRQMRVVPELVFLNCCHLGKLGTNPMTKFHRIAASVARELIQMGVAAVVAAGWAVNDAAAETFATTFYDELITQGVSFSAAVKAARNQTWKLHRESNTWGAYQCYGNPDFRLVVDDGGGGSSQTPFCSRHEYLSRFRGARAESNLAGFDDQRCADVAAELKRLHSAMKPEWADGEVESAYALAVAELGDYRTAIDTLEKARTAERATMPVIALEQLANFHARYAAELYQQTGNLTPDIREHFDKSLKLLEWLRQSGETSERLSLLGATWKRLAFVTGGTEQQEALRKSAEFYERAKQTGKLYPLLNWALVESFANPNRRAELVAEIDFRAGKLEQIARDATDFWDALAAIDGTFTRHIVSGAGANAIREVARDYRTAAVRFGTAVKLRSVREHFAFTAKMLRAEGRLNEAAAVEDIVAALT